MFQSNEDAFQLVESLVLGYIERIQSWEVHWENQIMKNLGCQD